MACAKRHHVRNPDQHPTRPHRLKIDSIPRFAHRATAADMIRTNVYKVYALSTTEATTATEPNLDVQLALPAMNATGTCTNSVRMANSKKAPVAWERERFAELMDWSLTAQGQLQRSTLTGRDAKLARKFKRQRSGAIPTHSSHHKHHVTVHQKLAGDYGAAMGNAPNDRCNNIRRLEA